MKLSSLCAGLALSALVFPLSGCFVSAGGSVSSDPGPGPSEGTLTVTYTVEGTTDPGACVDAYATEAELIVYDSSGSEFATAYAPCDDFVISVALPDGRYSADLTLIDGRSDPASTTLPLDGIRIISGTDLQIDADFPRSSILE